VRSAYVLLAIHYLQRTTPRVAPNLQDPDLIQVGVFPRLYPPPPPCFSFLDMFRARPCADVSASHTFPLSRGLVLGSVPVFLLLLLVLFGAVGRVL